MVCGLLNSMEHCGRMEHCGLYLTVWNYLTVSNTFDYLTVWNTVDYLTVRNSIIIIIIILSCLELFIGFYIIHPIGSLLLMCELPSQPYKKGKK